MKSINIAITDEGAMDFRCSEPMQIQDVLALTMNAQLCAMNKVLSEIPEKDKDAVKKDLFDMYNLGASNVLSVFAPEIEVHPELDVEEMLKVENDIIDAAYEEKVNAS